VLAANKNWRDGRSNRHTLWLSAMLVVIALSVFAWGTSYKLSLYKSAAEQGKMPAAKLCTRTSEAARNQVQATVSHNHKPAEFPSALVFALLLPVEQPAPDLPVSRPRPRSFLAIQFSPANHRRPPPAIEPA